MSRKVLHPLETVPAPVWQTIVRINSSYKYQKRRIPEKTGVLTEVLREGGLKLLVQAVSAEPEELLEAYATERDSEGRQRVVRNGIYLEERSRWVWGL